MAVFIGLYVIALSLSVCFFLWSFYSYTRSKRKSHRRQPEIELDPDSEPLLVSLYCQYLVAPQKALIEARQALLQAAAGRREALEIESMADFFEVLDLLQARSTAPLS